MKRSWSALVLATASLYTAPAQAASGVASVSIAYQERNNGFCDNVTYPTWNCTGSKYSHYSLFTSQPLRQVHVQVLRSSDNAVLGSGITNEFGMASVNWSTAPWEGAPLAYVRAVLQHKDDAFRIKFENFSTPISLRSLSNVQLVENGYANMTESQLGGTTLNDNANEAANLWGAAMRAWNVVNNYSASRNAWLNGAMVDIVLNSSAAADKGLSFYDPEWHKVHLFDHPDHRYNQFVLIHELGHHLSAELKSVNQGRLTSPGFSYVPTGGGLSSPGQHFMKSPEFLGVAFDEGFADFFAAISLWGTENSVTQRRDDRRIGSGRFRQ